MFYTLDSPLDALLDLRGSYLGGGSDCRLGQPAGHRSAVKQFAVTLPRQWDSSSPNHQDVLVGLISLLYIYIYIYMLPWKKLP